MAANAVAKAGGTGAALDHAQRLAAVEALDGEMLAAVEGAKERRLLVEDGSQVFEAEAGFQAPVVEALDGAGVGIADLGGEEFDEALAVLLAGGGEESDLFQSRPPAEGTSGSAAGGISTCGGIKEIRGTGSPSPADPMSTACCRRYNAGKEDAGAFA